MKTKFKVLSLFIVVTFLIIMHQNRIKATPTFDPDTKYTLNEYFGNGDFQYFEDLLKGVLQTEDEDKFSPKQLEDIYYLDFRNIAIKDFPKDLSIFKNLQMLNLSNITQLTTLGFVHNIEDSKLSVIMINGMSDLKSIENMDINYIKTGGYNTFSVSNTPNLELISNNRFVNGNMLNLSFRNIDESITNIIQQDSSNTNVYNSDNTLSNGTANRKTIDELKAMPNYNTVDITENNNFDFSIIEIDSSSLTNLKVGTNNTYPTYQIQSSIIDSFIINGTMNTQNKPENLQNYIVSSYINEYTITNISENAYLIMGISASSINKLDISGYDKTNGLMFGASRSLIKEIAPIIINETNSNLSMSFSISESSIEKISKFTINKKQLELDSGSYSNNWSFNTSHVGTFEGLEFKSLDNNSINPNSYEISFKQSNFDNIGDLSILNPNETTAKSEISFVDTNINTMGNINMHGSENKLSFLNSHVEEIKDISINNLTNLNISGLGLKYLGELDLPNIVDINLADNQLTKLVVKDNILPESLDNYNINGNQIAGDLPVASNKRIGDMYLNNFFNTKQENVTKQSSIVFDYNDSLYYSPTDSNIDINSLPVISLEANEEFNLKSITDNIKINNDEITLFEHHQWKYEVFNDNIARSNALQTGDNLVAVSLEGATPGISNNLNAKIFLKVIVKEVVDPIIDPIIDNPINPGKPIINNKIVASGLDFPIFSIIFLNATIVVGYLLYKRNLQK